MSQRGADKNREQFDRAFALMDDARRQVLALLGSVTQTQVDRRPAEGEWSVGEIAHHLALTERQVMAKVADLAAHAVPHEFDHAEVAKARAYRIEDAWDVNVTGKAAHPPELTPTPGRPLAELIRGLQETRAHTRKILAPHRDEDLGVKFFVHARFGPMTLYERLAFTASHDLKHLKQMERALARVRP